jgi:hypothetical protein
MHRIYLYNQHKCLEMYCKQYCKELRSRSEYIDVYFIYKSYIFIFYYIKLMMTK